MGITTQVYHTHNPQDAVNIVRLGNVPRQPVQQQEIVRPHPRLGKEPVDDPLRNHEFVVFEQPPGLEDPAHERRIHSLYAPIPAHNAPKSSAKVQMDTAGAAEAIPLEQLAQGRFPRTRTAQEQYCRRS
jgi:hypothetical protein